MPGSSGPAQAVAWAHVLSKVRPTTAMQTLVPPPAAPRPVPARPPAAVEVVRPLVDPSALKDLGSQLDSPAVAKGFARDYARMWDQRYQSPGDVP